MPPDLLARDASPLVFLKQLLAHYPGLEAVLCDYALDTDDLETAFGMLVMRPVALSPYGRGLRSATGASGGSGRLLPLWYQ